MTKPFHEVTLAARYVRKAKSSAERGIDFTLTFAQYRRLVSTKKCAYTGKILTEDNFSLDRIDASKGYVPGNVVACDQEFNRAKSSLTIEQVKLIVKALKRRRLL